MIHIRRVVSNDNYTAGVVIVNNEPVCVSIELPWHDNQVCISCIPAGEYKLCLKHESPKFGDCFSVENVPGRSDILGHPANRASELLGCFAPGRRFGKLDGEFAVLSSRKAMDDIRACFPEHQFWTKIRFTDDWKR